MSSELKVLLRRSSRSAYTQWPWKRSLILLRHVLSRDFKISNFAKSCVRERENEQRNKKIGEYETKQNI